MLRYALYVNDIEDVERAMKNHGAAPDTVLDRLKAALDLSSDSELSRKLSVPRGTLSSWRARGTVPWLVCVDVAERNNISLQWLIGGANGAASPDAAPPYPGNGDDDPYRAYLADEYRLVHKGGVKIDPDRGTPLPFPKSSLPVAFKHRYLENLLDGTDGRESQVYGYVAGDDRMEPMIREGWCVLVAATDNEIDDPGVYALLYGNATAHTFRRITPAGTTLHVHCDNPTYAPETIDMRTGRAPFTVLGRAVWAGGFLD